MVLLEDQYSNCSNNNSGTAKQPATTTGKKSKPKIPQRGLGVAQLEKILLEEQQKNAAMAAASASTGLILPIQPQPPVPSLAAAAAATSNSNSMFKHAPVDPNPLFRPSIPASPSPSAVDLFGPNTQHASNGGTTSFFPMSWNADGALRKYGYQSSIQNDSSNHDLKSSGFWHRRQFQQHQRHQQSFASMVNKTLSPSSSGVNLQIEPPSNQSYGSNPHMHSSWPEEERMVGMKRPCPFPFENTPNHPTFPCSISVCTSSFIKSSDESLQTYRKNAALSVRKGCSSSGSYQVDMKSSEPYPDKSVKENGANKDGGFLSLGSSLAPSSSFKSKQSMAIPSHHPCEYPEFNRPPYQGNGEDAVSDVKEKKQVPFYSFLPMGPNSCDAALSDGRGEALDGIDLNLKL